MSKRRTAPPASSVQTTKRLKFDKFGAANEADGLPLAHAAAQQQRTPNSAGVSIRPSPLAPATFPSLVSLAARVFAIHFRTLFVREDGANPEHGQAVREGINNLPDNLIPKILSLLRIHCPTYISAELLVLYFLRGRDICLADDIPGVHSKVLHAIGTRPDGAIVTSLELSGLKKINDQLFASVVSTMPELEKLVLRGCSKSGPLVLNMVASTCPRLKILNMNYTVATPQSVMSVLLACPCLQVLKVAGIPKLISGSVAALVKSHISEHPNGEDLVFSSLEKLKIRLTSLSDTDLAVFLPLCPNLTSLDISFTPVKHVLNTIGSDLLVPKLKKITLTSTNIPGNELVQVLDRLPALETLHLGALGESVPSTSKGVGMGTGAGTLTDSLLWDITDALIRCNNLKHVNLVGNVKIGSTGGSTRAIKDFVARVGRRCEILNFENIPNLRSGDLEGISTSSSDDLVSSVRILNLARTNIDDEAGIYIAACSRLEMLNVSGSKIGQDGLFTILNSCPNVSELDLTGCRSVSVLDRRRFFEVWESERQASTHDE